MAYATQLVKLDWRYTIILLLFLLIFFESQINWKTKGTSRTRETVIAISKKTIQVSKAWQLPNIT